MKRADFDLTFTLGRGATAGAAIDPSTGVLVSVNAVSQIKLSDVLSSSRINGQINLRPIFNGNFEFLISLA